MFLGHYILTASNTRSIVRENSSPMYSPNISANAGDTGTMRKKGKGNDPNLTMTLSRRYRSILEHYMSEQSMCHEVAILVVMATLVVSSCHLCSILCLGCFLWGVLPEIY